MSSKSNIITESEQPKVIDSVTSTITPEQALDSIDLTDPSTFIRTSSRLNEVKSNLNSQTEMTESERSQIMINEKDPDYLIYLDRKNAMLLKKLLIRFDKIKSELQARDMVNMELLNPDSVPESPDYNLARLMAQALTLLKHENSEEKNQVMNLYAYYAERAKSFMFFLVSDLLKGTSHPEIRCDLKILKTNTTIKNCRIVGINNILFLAVEIKVNKSNPNNTSGEELISYVGVSPYISLRAKDDENTLDTNEELITSDKNDEAEEYSSIVERTKQLVEKDENIRTPQTKSSSRNKSTSRTKSSSSNRESFFDSSDNNISESKEEASIPYITSTGLESSKNIDLNFDKANKLRDRVKNLINNYGNNKGGSISKELVKTPSDTINASESLADTSNIIMLKGGMRKNGTNKNIHKGGTSISANAPQTEVDIKLQKLLEQSKPGKRGRFESTSSPITGLCE